MIRITFLKVPAEQERGSLQLLTMDIVTILGHLKGSLRGPGGSWEGLGGSWGGGGEGDSGKFWGGGEGTQETFAWTQQNFESRSQELKK